MPSGVYERTPEHREWSRQHFREISSLGNAVLQAQRVGRTNQEIYGKEKAREITIQKSRTMKRVWKDPTYIKRWLRGQDQNPNKTESMLLEMLEDRWPGRYQSNIKGEGMDLLEVWGFKGRGRPDIVRVDGLKQVIYTNGSYWHGFIHGGITEEEYIGECRSVGIDCIVLWNDSPGDVIADWPSTVRRLEEGVTTYE